MPLPYWNRKLAAPDTVATAVRTIRAWQQAPGSVHDCPVCGAPAVQIVDRSARPYMEWYQFTCTTCGLDEAVNIPLPFHAPRMG
ncbi:MAG: hypothetical protein NW217_16630 [Hyphomicrobiaceae bacterium]|nr:hypothetical protein [Hyphomicrobiaceae bacterium]